MSSVTAKATIDGKTGAVLRGLETVTAWLDNQEAEAVKHMKTAVRVEGYRLTKQLKKEIKAGAPGGAAFDPLSHIARRLSRFVHGPGSRAITQSPNRTPLKRLFHGVRYNVREEMPFQMAVGFVQPGRGSHTVSRSWRRLAYFHQEGFDRSVSDSLRRLIVRRGAELGTVAGGNTPFFLRRDTRQFNTPARPIMDPFWRAHRSRALDNVRDNFREKMSGRRI